MKLQGQRPIKWSYIQVCKVIEEIYDETFTKNTQILQNKNNLAKKSTNVFVRSIKEYFLAKFKSEKLGNSNLINMLHSLSIYLEKYKNLYRVSKPEKEAIFLQIFEDFINQVYEPEDLLFFLFARSMLKKEFKLAQKTKQNEEEEIFLTIKEIPKFLICIVGKDSELIQDYKNMIMGQIDSDRISSN